METINLTELMTFGSSPPPTIADWDSAFDAFEKQVTQKPDKEQRRLRNQVQDRIVAASNQRCGEYKNFLKRFDSETNTILGGLATAIGGAGAIFKPADTARSLSGIAAIFSGWRAEVTADFFNNLAIQVITKGIEARRTELYDQMLTNRNADLTTYSVQRAVGDAAVYHYNCSLIAGLEKAADSIVRANNPGAADFNNFLKQLKEARTSMKDLVDPVRESTSTTDTLKNESKGSTENADKTPVK